MAAIVIWTTFYLSYKGYSYYTTPMLERFYHPDHENFKAGGLYGHGLGIVGTLLMLVGVVIYLVRKRYKFCARWGRLKYWLEFHIFLCTLGPVMILFHTAFKFGGIVSIAFWSMVAVVLSGVIGRYIYIQIPRTIEGRALSLNEIQDRKNTIASILANNYDLEDLDVSTFGASLQLQGVGNVGGNTPPSFFAKQKRISAIKSKLRANNLPRKDIRKVVRLVKEEMTINKRIERLQLMHKLFRYWHVAHLPFAVVMLVIVVLHVGITLAFGYTWIF
jgi:hypothetical protein